MADLFQGGADVAICPVENDYGVKLKALDALAWGTPLFASAQTLKGLPHLPAAPSIDLSAAGEAAAVLGAIVGDRVTLKRIAQQQAEAHERFITAQSRVWSALLESTPPDD